MQVNVFNVPKVKTPTPLLGAFEGWDCERKAVAVPGDKNGLKGEGRGR